MTISTSTDGTVDKKRLIMKFLLLGDERVGKTSLARRFLGKKFDAQYFKTIGVDISHINIETESFTCTITIWDLAGEEQFRAMRKIYFEGAKGIFLILDCTRDLHSESLLRWFEDIDETITDKISLALLANKIDLENDRKLTLEEIKGTALLLENQHKFKSIKYFETSAKTAVGVEEALQWLINEGRSASEEKLDFKNYLFNVDHYPFVLFKLSEEGTTTVFKSFLQLHFNEEIDISTFLIKLGVKVIVAVGQGHYYTEGINDLSAGEADNYRLFIYAFHKKDPSTDNPRYKIGYFQFIMFIPNKFYTYFPPFTKALDNLNHLVSTFSDANDLTIDNLLRMRKVILKKFRDLTKI